MVPPALSALLLAAAVALGAFGAHGLRDRVDPYLLSVWEKAVFYHFVHSLTMLLIPVLVRTQLCPESIARFVSMCMLVGVLLFSGSLYFLVISGVRILGAITPLGGVAFIAGWLVLAYGLSRSKLP